MDGPPGRLTHHPQFEEVLLRRRRVAHARHLRERTSRETFLEGEVRKCRNSKFIRWVARKASHGWSPPFIDKSRKTTFWGPCTRRRIFWVPSGASEISSSAGSEGRRLTSNKEAIPAPARGILRSI